MKQYTEYQKINSLYMRDEKTKKFTSEFSKPEFPIINDWDIFEKIDGTNIRICYTPKSDNKEASLYFGGRTENAQIPADLYNYLNNTFLVESFAEKFEDTPVILFGEGYGPKIQQGDYYRSQVGFILFDVSIGRWWLERDNLEEISRFFNVPIVPQINLGVPHTLANIESYVKDSPHSLFANQKHVMEGVVCRPNPLLLNRRAGMIVFKLKVKDFK